MEQDYVVNVQLTQDQVIALCKHFDKDYKTIEEYEVSNMVDELINHL